LWVSGAAPFDSWWYPTAGVPGWACGVSGAAPFDSWWYPTAGVPGWACGVSGAASFDSWWYPTAGVPGWACGVSGAAPFDSWWYSTAGVPGWACGVSGAAPFDSWWFPTAGVPGWACGVSGAAPFDSWWYPTAGVPGWACGHARQPRQTPSRGGSRSWMLRSHCCPAVPILVGIASLVVTHLCPPTQAEHVCAQLHQRLHAARVDARRRLAQPHGALGGVLPGDTRTNPTSCVRKPTLAGGT
jgi:hypothetical protein